ncbi:hypothetical protein B9Z55_003762 [Caenorhabditis nigoni]|uniref:Uncharacterized protein n=1 Tax=Caenorhabditis nigoni TaxID=1611254 RepID=A0A2G5VSJ7_9PELO|nr:hypothetical protein B9Z55_003762 [Caenorhabditis nigoni]
MIECFLSGKLKNSKNEPGKSINKPRKFLSAAVIFVVSNIIKNQMKAIRRERRRCCHSCYFLPVLCNSGGAIYFLMRMSASFFSRQQKSESVGKTAQNTTSYFIQKE